MYIEKIVNLLTSLSVDRRGSQNAMSGYFAADMDRTVSTQSHREDSIFSQQ